MKLTEENKILLKGAMIQAFYQAIISLMGTISCYYESFRIMALCFIFAFVVNIVPAITAFFELKNNKTI